jgi:broad specificity phosphatase PhoE
MSSVYLLRHCDYDNPRSILPGRLPVTLSQKGIEQAQQLQKIFAEKQIDCIYSSAVARCKQTAELISNSQIPIQYDQRLLETLSAYQGYWGENESADGYEFFLHTAELGGENLLQVQQRMASFWDEVAAKSNKNIIICSHGDPLMTLYYYVHQLPLPDDNVKETELKFWLEKGEFSEVLLPN